MNPITARRDKLRENEDRLDLAMARGSDVDDVVANLPRRSLVTPNDQSRPKEKMAAAPLLTPD